MSVSSLHCTIFACRNDAGGPGSYLLCSMMRMSFGARCAAAELVGEALFFA